MKPRTLVIGSTCKNGHLLATEHDIQETPYKDTRQGLRVDRRCRTCHQTQARNRVRAKSGIPLDAPVRRKQPEVKTSKQVLLNLINNNPEISLELLAIAKSLIDEK